MNQYTYKCNICQVEDADEEQERAFKNDLKFYITFSYKKDAEVQMNDEYYLQIIWIKGNVASFLDFIV